MARVRWLKRGKGRRAADGLNDRIWRAVVAAVSAAHSKDPDTHAGVFRRWSVGITADEQNEGALYVWYLLQHFVSKRVGAQPTTAELDAVADSIQDTFVVLVRGGEYEARETLRTAFALPPIKRRMAGGAFLMFGTAVLGALLDDSKPELARARPGLAYVYPTILENSVVVED